MRPTNQGGGDDGASDPDSTAPANAARYSSDNADEDFWDAPSEPLPVVRASLDPSTSATSSSTGLPGPWESLQPPERDLFRIVTKLDDVDKVRRLLREQPNIDINVTSDNDEKTALHQACARGHLAIAMELLKDPRVRLIPDSRGFLPLHYIAVQGANYYDEEAWAGNKAPLDEDIERCVNELLRLGAKEDVNATVDWDVYKSTKDMTPLHMAARKGNIPALRALLKQSGLQIDARTRNGSTALHLAFTESSAAAAEMLLNAGIGAQIPDDSGRTALHIASIAQRPEMIRALLPYSDVNTRNIVGDSALNSAIRCKNFGIVEILLDEGHADVHATDSSGRTSLHHLALHYPIDRRGECEYLSSEQEMIKMLRDHDLNMYQRENKGFSALDIASGAAGSGCPNIVKILLDYDYKTRVNEPSLQGWTALHHAARAGRGQNVMTLLERGADPLLCISTPPGTTAERLARIGGHVEVVDSIRRYRAWKPHTETEPLNAEQEEICKNELAWCWPSSRGFSVQMQPVYQLIYNPPNEKKLF